jgi:ComF family protein
MMGILDWILRLLFPPKCLLCRKVLRDEELDLCKMCRTDGPECTNYRKKLPFIDSWTAVWYYEDNARHSLLRYKFRGARSYAPGYGRLLAMKLQEAHPDGFDLLTWVPISPLRKFFRGYDQVELLAYWVGQELEIEPVALLTKIRHNRPQSRIVGDAQRRANVLGAYRAENRELFIGKRVVLLDDIITTGATAGECARVLLTAGVKEVHCGAMAVARHRANNKVR